MGKYSVEISSDAKIDLKKIHKSGNQAIIKKIQIILKELSEHPYEGIGKPEQLKHTQNIWSRRIDKKNRILYSVHDDIVIVVIYSALGHYNDK